ncbi:MAG: hypothetical protein ACOYOV_13145, partial [Bacteroidales bacterium]
MDNGLAINCTHTSATLTATGGVSYLWSDAGATASSTLNVTTAGTWTVTVTGANGCTNTATATTTKDISTPIVEIVDNGLAINCTHTSATLTA